MRKTKQKVERVPLQDLRGRTWHRALRESTNIRVAFHETEGVTWLIHRGWAAGYKAGLAAAKRKAK